MENPPLPQPGEEPDPVLDALNQIMNTMGGDASIIDTIERSSHALLDVNTEFPGLNAAILQRNAELAGQIRKYAELYNSPDLTERAEARRFLKLLADFSESIHEGRADEFDENAYSRFFTEPFAPEEMRGGILSIASMLRGDGIEQVRERYDLPAPAEDSQPSVFRDDEHLISALVVDTWLEVIGEAARGNKLLTLQNLVGPPDVRIAVVEAVLAHDYFATGTPAEKIDIVDRVLTKLPMLLHNHLTEQLDVRSRLRGDIEGL